MDQVWIKEETLTAIGDAVRSKTGVSGLLSPSEMKDILAGVKSNGLYLWSRKGMSEKVTEATGTSYTLTTPNTSRPSSTIEYSASAPVYEDGTWKMKNSTIETLINTDTHVPSATNVYVRLVDAPNVWYYVSAFTAGSLNTSGTCTKSMAYSTSYTAEAGSDVVGYAVTDDLEKYPDAGWKNGYYWECIGKPGVKIVSWADGTDEEIVAMIEAADAGEIDLTNYWSVGDTRSVNLSAMSATNVGESHEAQTVEFTLMHAGGYELNEAVSSGRTTCSFVVGMKNSLNTTGYTSSSTSAQVWSSQPRQTWCDDIFKSSLPESLLPIFKRFKLYYASAYNSTTTSNKSVLFSLPAEQEVLGTRTYATSAESNALFQFDWYKDATNRVKTVNTSNSAWWTRTISSSDSSRNVYISTTGTVAHYRRNYACGISPFGCI